MIASVKAIKPILLLSLICLICFAPFANKKFHIDSTVTAYMAQQILVNPLNPPLGEFGRHLIPWNHTDLPETSAFYATPHPPLLPLYSALIVKLFGLHEQALNWSFFPFYLLSVLLCYQFARRIQLKYAVAAAILFAVSPMVFVNSQNIMNDMPVTALMMASLYYMIKNDRYRSALLAGLFAGLACLTKFTAGSLIISAIVFYGYKRQWRNLLLFSLPFLICNGLWLLHNQIVFHKMQLFANGHAHYIWGDIRYRFERMISFIGGTIILPVFVLLIGVVIRKYRFFTIGVVGVSLTWALALRWHLHYSTSSCLLYALCASAGILMLGGSLLWFRRTKSEPAFAALSTHVLLQAVGGLFLTLYAVRYALPMAFVFILWLIMVVEQLKNIRFERIIVATAIGSSILLSLMLSLSDYQVADAECRIAQDVKQDYPLAQAYFRGRLGYLYYMKQAGFSDIRVDEDRYVPGDVFVINGLYKTDHGFIDGHHLALHKTYRYPLFPLRTIGGRAGFYGHDRLPYAYVRPSEYQFLIYR